MVKEKLKKVKRVVEIAKMAGNFIRPKENKLNALKFGLAGGIVSAIYIFAITLGAVLGFNGLFAWTLLIKGIYGFLGYNVSYLGAILGAIYGFLDGFIITYLFAWVYNKLL